ncbi:MAG: sulfurtransferase, partial [Gammaproteobacteria bacterium]
SMWVSIEFVEKQLQANKIDLLDARSSDRFTAKDSKTDPVPGHIPGAISFPFAGNISKQSVFLPAEELSRRFMPVISNAENKEAVSMCGSGVTACHNLLALSIAGLPMMRLFVGSWSEWIKDKSRPVATGESL